MSKRNTESLRSFFSRCNERVEGFNPMTCEIQPYLGGGHILCRRGDLYLVASLDDEFEVENYLLALATDSDPAPVDPQIARWLTKRARKAQNNLETEDRVFRDTDAACLTVISGDLPQEHKTLASHHVLEARDRLNEAERAFETEAEALAEYIIGCGWGQVGNTFVGRRRLSWDGHRMTRLVIQGRTCALVRTNKNDEVINVVVTPAEDAENFFRSEREGRKVAEAAYLRELQAARVMVRRWKRGENVEFEFVTGQEGGYITFEHEGKTLVVSARGAGIYHGFDPEFGYHSASSEDLRQYDREQDFEANVQRGGLWRSPEAADYKVRINGEWFGCQTNKYTLGDAVQDVGRVQAIARG